MNGGLVNGKKYVYACVPTKIEIYLSHHLWPIKWPENLRQCIVKIENKKWKTIFRILMRNGSTYLFEKGVRKG